MITRSKRRAERQLDKDIMLGNDRKAKILVGSGKNDIPYGMGKKIGGFFFLKKSW